MKKVLVFLVLLFSLIGCESKEGKESEIAEKKDIFSVDSSDIKTEPLSGSDVNFRLKYNFKPGQTYKYRLTSISNINEKISGPTPWGTDTTVSNFINQSTIYVIELKLNEADSESMEVDCLFSNIKIDHQDPQNVVNYVSGTKKDSSEKIRFAQYESIINNPFSFRVTRYGEVGDVFRTDKIISKYLDISGLKDSVNNEQKNLIRTDFRDTFLKGILSQIFRQIPEGVLSIDSSWSVQLPSQRYISFNINSSGVYQISNLEKLNNEKIAVIDASVKIDIKGDNNFTQQGVTYKIKTPEIIADGKIYFNIDDGVIIKSRTKTRTESSVVAEGNTPMGKLTQRTEETITNTGILELL